MRGKLDDPSELTAEIYRFNSNRFTAAGFKDG
jgi:hypothetical protein